MTVPILTYGSKIWTIIKKQEAKIETVEMKFLRNEAGCTRKDQTRNTKIREELNIFNLSNKILKYRSPWKFHVLRMEDRRILQKILIYNPKRRQKIGWRRDQHTLQDDGTDQAWPNP
jgi:hypothetical protein